MDAIKTYLDNVFAAFGQTERALALKREMLAGMEEKYNSLKAEGKSEHEAVGGVIANFGSIDEIAAELGVGQTAPETDEGVAVSRDEAVEYLTQTRKSGLWIGLGVWLIMTGVCALLVIGWFYGDDDLMGAIGVLSLLLTVAGAVPMFIVNGMKLNSFKRYDENPVRLDGAVRAELETQKSLYMPRFVTYISAGVAAIILAVGAFIILGSLGYEISVLVMLLSVIGCSAFLMIRAGMMKSAYDVLLNEGEYANKKKNKQAERVIGTAAAVFWPVMAAVYLLWSFIGDDWGSSWLIWPVAGILFGAFAGGVGSWYERKG